MRFIFWSDLMHVWRVHKLWQEPVESTPQVLKWWNLWNKWQVNNAKQESLNLTEEETKDLMTDLCVVRENNKDAQDARMSTMDLSDCGGWSRDEVGAVSQKLPSVKISAVPQRHRRVSEGSVPLKKDRVLNGGVSPICETIYTVNEMTDSEFEHRSRAHRCSVDHPGFLQTWDIIQRDRWFHEKLCTIALWKWLLQKFFHTRERWIWGVVQLWSWKQWSGIGFVEFVPSDSLSFLDRCLENFFFFALSIIGVGRASNHGVQIRPTSFEIEVVDAWINCWSEQTSLRKSWVKLGIPFLVSNQISTSLLLKHDDHLGQIDFLLTGQSIHHLPL